MRENLQNGLMALRRKLGPMKAVILVELFSALALVLYINGVFSSGPKAEVGGMLLMGFVLTFLQPKTQFGLVWTWQDKIQELSTAPLEDMGEGIEDLRVQRKEGLDQLRTFVMVSPVFLLLELGISGTASYWPGVLFGVLSYLIFEVWQHGYRAELDHLLCEA